MPVFRYGSWRAVFIYATLRNLVYGGGGGVSGAYLTEDGLDLLAEDGSTLILE